MSSRKKKQKPTGSLAAMAAEDLAKSGLTLEDATEVLGMELWGPEQSAKAGFDPLPALKIAYYGPDGKPMVDGPRHPPFYRVRYLAQPKGFSQATGKFQKYSQPSGTICCAYFPQNQENWPGVLQNNYTPLIITEGEKKAAAACKAGLPAIGLGGVYNWRALKKGVEFLPELEAVNWDRRNVYMAYDSDYRTNPMVCKALYDLAEQLVDRGAYVHLACMPMLSADGKTGLDDFLVEMGTTELEKLLHNAQSIGLTKVLFDFNERFIFINEPGLVLKKSTLAKMAPAPFRNDIMATKTYQEQVLKPDGEISHKLVSASAAWISWPLRAEAERLTYKPGQPKVIEGVNHYNIWPGWGLGPKKGDVKPFQQLLSHIFTGAEPEAMEWFLSWLAYPLQYPGTKLFSAAVIHGTVHGTGKSLIGTTMGRIYGANFATIGQGDLHGGFNEWAEAKQFVMGDDVTGSNKREDNDLLKKLITQDEMRVNVKYVPSYVVPDCINYLFNSNHPDAFFLEDSDRRYFIQEVLVDPLNAKFYQMYAGVKGQAGTGWLDTGGAAAVFDWLLKRDLKGFDPSAAAFRTEARERIISDVQSDLGSWVRRLKALPDQVLKLGEIKLEKDLYTAKELLRLYDPTEKTRVSANGLGRELKRANMRQALGGNLVQPKGMDSERYYIVRNAAKWVSAKHGACVDHILKYSGKVTDPKQPKF